MFTILLFLLETYSEVVGAHNIITLWDVFVELVSEGWEWMAIMETTAASRILLCRDQLLSNEDSNNPAARQHHAMDMLMNMPPGFSNAYNSL